VKKYGVFTFLGTGGSSGVPQVGCDCKVCRSSAVRDKRLRPAGWIQVAGLNLILDVGPDFRTQILRHQIQHIDGILLTHAHFDHIAGIDDLRPFSLAQREKIPCLLSGTTFEELKIRYHYLIHPHAGGKTYCAQIHFQVLEREFGDASFLKIPFRVVSYFQGGTQVTGYRLGSIAYLSDIREYTQQTIEEIKGVDVLILGAKCCGSSPFHFSIEEAVHFSELIGASQTFLTHLGHDQMHEEASGNLPPHVHLSYDGLEVIFEYT